MREVQTDTGSHRESRATARSSLASARHGKNRHDQCRRGTRGRGRVRKHHSLQRATRRRRRVRRYLRGIRISGRHQGQYTIQLRHQPTGRGLARLRLSSSANAEPETVGYIRDLRMVPHARTGVPSPGHAKALGARPRFILQAQQHERPRCTELQTPHRRDQAHCRIRGHIAGRQLVHQGHHHSRIHSRKFRYTGRRFSTPHADTRVRNHDVEARAPNSRRTCGGSMPQARRSSQDDQRYDLTKDARSPRSERRQTGRLPQPQRRHGRIRQDNRCRVLVVAWRHCQTPQMAKEGRQG